MVKPKKSRHRRPKDVPQQACSDEALEQNGQAKDRFLTFLECVLPIAAAVFLWWNPIDIDWDPPGAASGQNRMTSDEEFTALKAPALSSDLEEALKYPTCRFVMSESAPGWGWGVFSLVDLKQNEKLLFSDLRIQVVNVQTHQYAGLEHLIHNFSWTPKYGQVEGTEVQTIIPGMSMLSNTGWGNKFHAIAGTPDPPEPGLEDGERGSVTAGSFTHYHNRQFYSIRNIPPGQELLVSYGQEFVGTKLSSSQLSLESLKQPVDVLKEKGMCLDNIASAPAPSRGGRGAFATRLLPKGSVVAPLPLIPLNRTSLDMEDDEGRKQLLLNYCFGHANSTLLFFSHAPVVNYINSVNSDEQPNAELRWSHRAWNLQESLQMSAHEVLASRRWGLLLELVALRDISAGEQVLIDYGREWRQAWDHHVLTFSPGYNAKSYVYANRMNQLEMIRSADEQQSRPYPDNVRLSCIYKYHLTMNYPLWPNSFDQRNRVTHYEWKQHGNQRLVPDYLRPCRILARTAVKRSSKEYTYTVEVLNPPSSSSSDSLGRIPRGERHVVSSMPRAAIRFTDKPYSTDQNLANAFRHEIGLPEGVVPKAWMDL